MTKRVHTVILKSGLQSWVVYFCVTGDGESSLGDCLSDEWICYSIYQEEVQGYSHLIWRLLNLLLFSGCSSMSEEIGWAAQSRSSVVVGCVGPSWIALGFYNQKCLRTDFPQFGVECNNNNKVLNIICVIKCLAHSLAFLSRLISDLKMSTFWARNWSPSNWHWMKENQDISTYR